MRRYFPWMQLASLIVCDATFVCNATFVECNLYPLMRRPLHHFVRFFPLCTHYHGKLCFFSNLLFCSANKRFRGTRKLMFAERCVSLVCYFPQYYFHFHFICCGHNHFAFATSFLFCGTCPPQRNEYSKPNRIMASYGSADPAAAAGTAGAPTYLQRAVHSCAAPKPCYNFARGDFPQRFRLRPANMHGQPWQQTPLLVGFPGVSTCVRCP